MNNKYANGVITRNKSRLVAQSYTQIEKIDFKDAFPPSTHHELIRVLIGFVCYFWFKLYQMDVKSFYLNSVIKKEFYVE